MRKTANPEADPEAVPAAPPPSAPDHEAGRREATQLAARYLPDCVRLLAAVAFGDQSVAKLHTRVLAAQSLIDLSTEKAPTA